MKVILPPKGRDLRLDLLRGLANWAIFLDHIPNNVVNWITTRNYGFSDAADLFVFISGYTASFVYARIMLERGALVAGTRIIKRAWQIYVAHVFLFVIYVTEIGYLAEKYHDPKLDDEFNIHGFLEHPAQMLYEGLILKFKPVNMDVLPLYIVLMVTFPAVLWGLVRQPNMVMIASAVLYFIARQFDLNLPSYPSGTWYFNPFCWQLLFVFGAWFALGGAILSMPFIKSRRLLVLAIAYLAFAFIMTMASRFSALRAMFPDWLYNAFNPNDKTNLAPYRFLHFATIALLVARFLPRDWPGLEWRMFRPAILCGQQSLEVFCTGVFLAFAAHFVLVEINGAIWMQILVSVVGITALSILAWYRSWSKRIDKPMTRPTPAPIPVEIAKPVGS
jgi:hypothetical protein